MKELIVFNPSIEDGGVEKNLYLIVNYLTLKGLNVSLISSDLKKKKKFNKKVNFITPKLFNYNNSGRYYKYFRCLIILILKILKNRHLIIMSFQANIYALIICKILKIKIITRLNTAPQGWEHNKIKGLIYSYFIKKADMIIVNSKEFKKEVDKRYKINSTCVFNPFDFKKIKKLSKIKVKKIFKKNTLKIINVGRLTIQKDQMVILKAVKNVAAFRKIQLIIIGKGKQIHNQLQNFININKLQENVKLLGYKSNPFPYIKQSEIFVLSSKFEGLPNVLIESQFLKKFIISTNCPTGPKEILNNGKYGYLFNVGDYKKLANILRNFKINKSQKKMIKDGYKKTKDFNYKIICNQYYNLIKKFI